MSRTVRQFERFFLMREGSSGRSILERTEHEVTPQRPNYDSSKGKLIARQFFFPDKEEIITVRVDERECKDFCEEYQNCKIVCDDYLTRLAKYEKSQNSK